jgi:hypothetical protein
MPLFKERKKSEGLADKTSSAKRTFSLSSISKARSDGKNFWDSKGMKDTRNAMKKFWKDVWKAGDF